MIEKVLYLLVLHLRIYYTYFLTKLKITAFSIMYLKIIQKKISSDLEFK